MHNLRYIVVEGCAGSGKTELCRRLSEHFQAASFSDMPQNSPFLKAFCADASRNGLAAELDMLLRRRDLMAQMTELDTHGERVVSDFLPEKNQIYAPATLRPDEQTLYWQCAHSIMSEHPVPDLVIYLDKSAATDRHLDAPPEFLQRTVEGYVRFFHVYDRAPLLVVNAERLDCGSDETHFALLLEAVADMGRQRHYLNVSE